MNWTSGGAIRETFAMVLAGLDGIPIVVQLFAKGFAREVRRKPVTIREGQSTIASSNCFALLNILFRDWTSRNSVALDIAEETDYDRFCVSRVPPGGLLNHYSWSGLRRTRLTTRWGWSRESVAMIAIARRRWKECERRHGHRYLGLG
jgi:hypothetical protein